MSNYDGYEGVDPAHADYEAEAIRERQAARQRETARLKQAALEDRIERLESEVRCLERLLHAGLNKGEDRVEALEDANKALRRAIDAVIVVLDNQNTSALGVTVSIARLKQMLQEASA